MWFETLTGFSEENSKQVRSMLQLDGDTLTSLAAPKRTMRCGKLSTPSLTTLLNESEALMPTNNDEPILRVGEVVAEIHDLFRDATNAYSVFQCVTASNLLSIPYPEVTPCDGVSAYEYDTTQGALCAIACGGATLYRNYYSMDGNMPQDEIHQIDCLHQFAQYFNADDDEPIWEMHNGYALPSLEGLQRAHSLLSSANEAEVEQIRGRVCIGVQTGAQVTLADADHLVTLALCPALPVAFTPFGGQPWDALARTVLEAIYEATLCAALINRERTGCDKVFLTLVGHGTLGNEMQWIIDAMRAALFKFRFAPLSVFIICENGANEQIKRLVREF